MNPHTKKLVYVMPARKQQPTCNLVPRKMISTAQDDSKKDKSNGAATRVVYRQGVAEVFRIKGILEKVRESEWVVICDLLAKLKYMGLTLNTLEVTGIGKTVKVLRKHSSKEVSRIAGRLMKEWKDMVDEWVKNDAGSVVNQTSEGEVMPESLITEQKSRVDLDKENKAMGRVITVQESKKVLVQQRVEATKSSLEEKYEMAKRKLQQGYQEAENAKKKRRVKVMELHELSKFGLLPRQDKPIKRQNCIF